ncbi:MAG: SUMF1/EgtB/PvdO family nonheme iron enzyme [Planctomycetota bacterium]
MVIQVGCGKCKQIIRAEEQFFGKTVKCPNCQTHLRIPDPRREGDQPPDPMVGKMIAHYQIEALLGQGGMGKVYRAHNTKLNKTCALKVLPEEFARQDKSHTDRFIREAQSAANVEHVNVLPVWYVGNEGNIYFIEMQYVDGGTLDRLIEGGKRLKVNDAVRIVRDVAAGLAAAHDKSIIHRDIKPSNVMLTKAGEVKVADFGLARMGEVTTKLTVSGMIMGTPLYMSPEQAQGMPLDHRSDIYSLGVMFYQLLTGTPPYTADTPLPLLNKHVNEPIPDIRLLLPDASAELVAVINRMMAKNRDERYQSCDAVVNDLNALLTSLDVMGAMPTTGLSAATAAKARELAPKAKKSRAGLFAAVGVAALLLAAGIGIFMAQARKPEPIAKPAPPAGTTKPIGDDQQGKKDDFLQIAKLDKDKDAASRERAELAAERAKPVELAQVPADKETAEKSSRQPGKSDEKPVASTLAAAPPAAEAETKAQTEPKEVDLAQFAKDVEEIDKMIAARNYADARSRASLLKGKYAGLIETKIANLNRIIALREKCFDRVNSGKVKLAMKDISRRYGYAGEIKKADDDGLTAKIAKKWTDLDADEALNFYRKASDPDSPDDLLALAALMMEGAADEKSLDAAMLCLGKAKEKGAEVEPILMYLETLKQARGKALESAEARDQKSEVRDQKSEEEGGKSARASASASASSDSQKSQPPGGPKPPGGFDEVYVATAATGDKIPHPLSRKTETIQVGGKTIKVPEGMVYIPAGSSVMGSGPNPPEGPQHQVYLDGYFIGKYEVTNAEYAEFVKATNRPPPQHWAGGKIPKGRENHPVVHVSWDDATAYAAWCGKRLPTEAEWEKAAGWDLKKKRHHEYPWGDEYDSRRANHCYALGCRCDGDAKTHTPWWEKWSKSEEGKKAIAEVSRTAAVGQFKGDESSFKCFDFGGNIREWVNDCYGEDYYKVGPKKNPPGPTEAEATPPGGNLRRVARGGFWSSYGPFLRTALRIGYGPSSGNHHTGFRCAADCPWPALASTESKTEEEISRKGAKDAKGGVKGGVLLFTSRQTSGRLEPFPAVIPTCFSIRARSG